MSCHDGLTCVTTARRKHGEVKTVLIHWARAFFGLAQQLQKNGCKSGQQHGAEAPFVRGSEAVFSGEIYFVLRGKAFGFQRQCECFSFFDAGEYQGRYQRRVCLDPFDDVALGDIVAPDLLSLDDGKCIGHEHHYQAEGKRNGKGKRVGHAGDDHPAEKILDRGDGKKEESGKQHVQEPQGHQCGMGSCAGVNGKDAPDPEFLMAPVKQDPHHKRHAGDQHEKAGHFFQIRAAFAEQEKRQQHG